MRGLSEQEFASVLKDSFLSVWIDEKSSYTPRPVFAEVFLIIV
jgi:hypothetical protein